MSGLVAMVLLGLVLIGAVVGAAVLVLVGAALAGACWGVWSLANRSLRTVGGLPERLQPPTAAGSVFAPLVVEPVT